MTGNVNSAIPYKIAAHKRTLSNPASRAIKLASGVATTENAPFKPQAQGSKPLCPARLNPNGNGKPNNTDTGATTASSAAARASQGQVRVAITKG